MNNIKPQESSYYLRELINILKHESRFVLKEPYKSLVDSIIKMVIEQYTSVLYSDSMLYRARINKIDFSKKKHDETPFPSNEMGHPPEYLAVPGRINPEGIPYLYCSGELDTAAAELRPWKGSFLTIGEVNIKRDINIVDLTLECKDNEWSLFYYDFSEIFSFQWPHELQLNYLITQYFSEQFKANGFRGIKYTSAFNLGGNNYALFHKDDYEINKTYSVETIEIDYCFYKLKNV